jgi:hypothetical protein
MKGTRNGKPFRYRAALPHVVTDLLPGCPNLSCFYRLPWAAGSLEDTTQGNGPGFSHNNEQEFAWDFVMPDGMHIVATRGGVVGDLVESGSMNFNPCGADPNADGPSNFVRIDHQDGTYSYYAHVRQWSAQNLAVQEGDVVERGQAIARVGNVGRSCGPHLHYQVAIDNTKTIYGQTTSICFEALRLDWELWDLDLVQTPCYVPVTDDLLGSTNA